MKSKSNPKTNTSANTSTDANTMRKQTQIQIATSFLY